MQWSIWRSLLFAFSLAATAYCCLLLGRVLQKFSDPETAQNLLASIKQATLPPLVIYVLQLFLFDVTYVVRALEPDRSYIPLPMMWLIVVFYGLSFLSMYFLFLTRLEVTFTGMPLILLITVC